VRLAHAPCNQLRDLRAEIEDEDLVVHGGRLSRFTRGTRPRRPHAAPRSGP
jgi:hypothetical protein